MHPASQECLPEQPFLTRRPQGMTELLLRLELLILLQLRLALPQLLLALRHLSLVLPPQTSRQELLSFLLLDQRTR